MSLPILCVHTDTHTEQFQLLRTNNRTAKFDLIPFRMTHSKHCCFFPAVSHCCWCFSVFFILVVMVTIHSLLPLRTHWRCWASSWQQFLHKVNEQMRLLISVILSRIFRFRFLYLGQMFYLSILFTRMMCDLKASEKRKELKPEIVNSTNRTYSKNRTEKECRVCCWCLYNNTPNCLCPLSYVYARDDAHKSFGHCHCHTCILTSGQTNRLKENNWIKQMFSHFTIFNNNQIWVCRFF